jgi:hypothetical protein
MSEIFLININIYIYIYIYIYIKDIFFSLILLGQYYTLVFPLHKKTNEL